MGVQLYMLSKLRPSIQLKTLTCIHVHDYYTSLSSRRSRTRDTVKEKVCVCVPAVTAQRLQCEENQQLLWLQQHA